MNYTNLGKTGLKVSRICLGCMSYGLKEEREWGLDEEQSRPFVKRALELGINFFDTANMYGTGRSEEVLGRALRDFAKRDDVVVATKVYFPMRSDVNGRGLSRKAIMTEIDNSLRRLGTDYVDLYQIHRWDYDTPIEENTRSPPRCRKIRKGALHRGIIDVRLAILQSALPGRPPQLDAFCFDAATLQPAESRGGTGDVTSLPGGRYWCAAVEPTGPRSPCSRVGDAAKHHSRSNR